MKTKQAFWLVTAMLIFLAGSVLADRDREYGRTEVNETFSDIEMIKINTVSGDCVVSAAGDDKVSLEVTTTYRPRDNFEAIYRVKGKTLILKEDFVGSTRGSATWRLAVPQGIKIRFSSASGDFETSDMKTSIDVETASGDIDLTHCEGEFDIETASGDITFNDCRGELEVETASGDISADNSFGNFDFGTASGEVELDGCAGEFSLGTASGDIDVRDVVFEHQSSFDAASGDIYVTLAKTAEYDLELSTASGRVLLDYNGNPVKGFFEFTAKVKNGDIDAPYKFDNIEEFERRDQDYVRKSFTHKGDAPEIVLETASGRVALEE